MNHKNFLKKNNNTNTRQQI